MGSYFSNDQSRLKELIGENFLTINPGEEHWQNRDEFLRERKLSLIIKGS
jgi:hypothetical protein